MAKFHREGQRPINKVHWTIANVIVSGAIDMAKANIDEKDHEEFFDMMSVLFSDMSEHAAKHLRGERCEACEKAKSRRLPKAPN